MLAFLGCQTLLVRDDQLRTAGLAPVSVSRCQRRSLVQESISSGEKVENIPYPDNCHPGGALHAPVRPPAKH